MHGWNATGFAFNRSQKNSLCSLIDDSSTFPADSFFFCDFETDFVGLGDALVLSLAFVSCFVIGLGVVFIGTFVFFEDHYSETRR